MKLSRGLLFVLFVIFIEVITAKTKDGDNHKIKHNNFPFSTSSVENQKFLLNSESIKSNQQIGDRLIFQLSRLTNTELSEIPLSLSNNLNALNGNFSEILISKFTSNLYKSSAKPLNDIITTIAEIENVDSLKSIQDITSTSFISINALTEVIASSIGSSTATIFYSSLKTLANSITTLTENAFTPSAAVNLEVKNIATSINILFLVLSIIFESISATLTTVSLVTVQALSIIVFIFSTLLTIIETILAIVSVTIISNNQPLSTTVTGVTIATSDILNSITTVISIITSSVTLKTKDLWTTTISSSSNILTATTLTLTSAFSSIIEIFGNFDVSDLIAKHRANQLETLITSLSVNVGQLSGSEIYNILNKQFPTNTKAITTPSYSQIPIPTAIIPASTGSSVLLTGGWKEFFVLLTSNANFVFESLSRLDSLHLFTSASFSSMVTFISNTLPLIPQYSGSLLTILKVIDSSLSTWFKTFIQLLSNYSSLYFGNASTALLQNISSLQTTLTALIRNYNNPAIVNSSVAQIADYLGYHVVIITVTANVIVGHVTNKLIEARAVISYVTFTIFVLIEYVLLLIVSLITNATAVTNVTALITSTSLTIKDATFAFSIFTNHNVNTEEVFGDIIEKLTKTTFGYLNSIQSITSTFGNNSFNYQATSSSTLAQFQRILNEPTFQIGTETGYQIFSKITKHFPFIVPNLLYSLGGPVTGQYELFVNNVKSLASSFASIASLNLSPTLSFAATASSSIVSDVLDYVGSAPDVLISFLFSFSASFSTFSQIIVNYSDVLGRDITNVLLGELSTYQNSLTTLIKQFSKNSIINENIIEIINNLQYVYITIAKLIATIISNGLLLGSNEVFIALAIVTNTVSVLSNFAFFLITSQTNDATALENIQSILSLNKDVPTIVNILTSLGNSINVGKSFTSAVQSLLPNIINETIDLINNLKPVPNVFSKSNLTISDIETNIVQLQSALSQTNIGEFSGSQITNLISTAFSVPAILSNLSGDLSGIFDLLVGNIKNALESLKIIVSSNTFTSSSFSTATQFINSTLAQILHYSGSQSSILENVGLYIPELFQNIDESLSDYLEIYFGSSSEIVSQILTTLQSSINDLVINSTNLTVVNASISSIAEYIGHYIVLLNYIGNVNVAKIDNTLDEAILVFRFVGLTLFPLVEYILLLIASLNSDVTLQSNIIVLITSLSTTYSAATNAFNAINSSGLRGSVVSLPLFTKTSFDYINLVQNVTSTFGNTPLTYQLNPDDIITEIEKLFNEQSISIGKESGWAVLNKIKHEQSLITSYILPNLDNNLTQVFNNLASNIITVSNSLERIASINVFSSSSFSSVTTFLSKSVAQILQYRDSPASILENIGLFLPTLFHTITELISHYLEIVFGSNSTTISQIIENLQLSLTNLVQNSTNLTVINASVSNIADQIGQYVILLNYIANVVITKIDTTLEEAILVFRYFALTIFPLVEYILILVVSVNSNVVLPSNVISLIISISAGFDIAINALKIINTSDPQGFVSSIPFFAKSSFGFVNSIQNITSTFGKTSLSFQLNPEDIIKEIENLFSEQKITIGNKSGSEYLNIIKHEHALVKPNIILNLNGDLTQVFNNLLSNSISVSKSLAKIDSTSEFSPSFSSVTTFLSNSIAQILQYSGDPALILNSIGLSLPTWFQTINELIAGYLNVFYGSSATIVSHIITTLQVSLTNLIQNSTNVTAIDENVSNIVDNIAHYVILLNYVSNVIVAKINVTLEEALLVFRFVGFAIFPLIEYVLLLIVSLNSNVTLPTNILSFINAFSFRFNALTKAFITISTQGTVASIPLFAKATIACINDIQKITSTFGNVPLSLESNPDDIVSAIDNLFSKQEITIGNKSGSEFLNIIKNEHALVKPNIILNLNEDLTQVFNYLLSNSISVSKSFTKIASTSEFSPSFSSVTTFLSNSIAKILQNSGDPALILNSIGLSLPTWFQTINELIAGYLNVFYGSSATIVSHIITTLQVSLTNLVQNSTNVTAIDENVSIIADNIAHYVILLNYVSNVIVAKINVTLEEALLVFRFVGFAIFPLIEYVLLLIVSLNSNVILPTNIFRFITFFSFGFDAVTKALNNLSTQGTVASIPLFAKATIACINDMQTITSTFGNVPLSFQSNPDDIVSAIDNLFSKEKISIGKEIGSELLNKIKNDNSLVVSKIISNLNEDLAQVYNRFISNIKTLSESLSKFITINDFSPSFSSVAIVLSGSVAQIKQYSGSSVSILESIGLLIPTLFQSISKVETDYSYYLGSSSITLSQIISTLQVALANLVQNSTDLTIINASVSSIADNIGHYVIVLNYIANIIVDKINTKLEEAILVFRYVAFAIFSIIEYTLFLVVSVNSNVTLPANIFGLITSISLSFDTITNALKRITDSGSQSIIGSSPLLTKTSFDYINSVQEFSSTFGNTPLSYLPNPDDIIDQIENLIFVQNISIGNQSGSVVINTIKDEHSLGKQNILLNLNEDLTQVYDRFISNIRTVSISLDKIASIHLFTSASFSSVATFVSKSLAQILQYSGSPSSILDSISFSLSKLFQNINELISDYSDIYFGGSSTTFFQIIGTLQNSLTTLVQNRTNLTVINTSVGNIADYIAHYVVLLNYIANHIIDNLSTILEEAILVFRYFAFGIFTLIEYVLLLIVSVNSNVVLPTNIFILLTHLSSFFDSATYALTNLSSFGTQGIVTSIPLFAKATFIYVNLIQNITSTFGNIPLVYQSYPDHIISELENLYVGQNISIGNKAASELLNTIKGDLSVVSSVPVIVRSIIPNLSEGLTSTFNLLLDNIKTVSDTLTHVITSNVFSSSSFYSVVTFINNTLSSILQYSGSALSRLKSIDSIISAINSYGQSISLYSIEFYNVSTTTYLQVLKTLEKTLSNLIKNSSNLAVINSSIVLFTDYIGYYIVLINYTANLIIDNISAVQEASTVIAYLSFLIFSLVEYALLLVISINPIESLSTNTLPFITSLSTIISNATDAFIPLSDPQSGGIIASIPVYTNASLTYLNSVQSITTAFGNKALTFYPQSAKALVEYEAIFNEPSFRIGEETGSQIFKKIKSRSSVTVPNKNINQITLPYLGEDLNETFNIFISNINVVYNTLTSLSSLNLFSSSSFSLVTIFTTNSLSKILKFSGSPSSILNNIDSFIPYVFTSIPELLAGYSEVYFGSSEVTFLQIVSTLQSALKNLSENSTNLEVIDSSVTIITNNIGYYMVLVNYIGNVLITAIDAVLEEALTAIRYVIFTMFTLIEYVLLLIASINHEANVTSNINLLIITLSTTIKFATNGFTAGSFGLKGIVASIPLFTKASFMYFNSVQSITSAFGNVKLAYDTNPNKNLATLQHIVQSPNFVIGNKSGSEIFNKISNQVAFIPYILLKHTGKLSGIYELFKIDSSTIFETFAEIVSQNLFSSSTFSETVTFIGNIQSEYIQHFGSSISILNNIGFSIPAIFSIINELISDYSALYFGSIASTVLHATSQIQISLSSIIQNNTNTTILKASVSNLTDNLGYFLVVINFITNLIVDQIGDSLAEVLIAVTYIIFTIFALSEYILLIITAVNPVALSHISELIVSISVTIHLSTTPYKTLSNSSSAIIVDRIVASVPQFTEVIFGYVNSVQSISTAFGNKPLKFQESTSALISQLENVFNGPNFRIGTQTGTHLFSSIVNQFSNIIPNFLFKLDGSLAGQYELYFNYTGSFSNSIEAVGNLDTSISLSSASIYCRSILNEIVQYSGLPNVVLVLFSHSLPNYFDIFANITSNYSTILGSDISNIFLDELSLYQTALTTVIQDFVDPTSIEQNAIEVINTYEYLLVTSATLLATAISSGVVLGNDDVFVALIIIIGVSSTLNIYTLFWLIPSVTDSYTLDIISTVVQHNVPKIGAEGLISTFLSNLADSTVTDANLFTANVISALPGLINSSIAFIAFLQSVPNVFSKSALSISDIPTDLLELQTALSQVSGNIGRYTGSQIVTIITETFSVPNILLNLPGSLSGVFNVLISNVKLVAGTFTKLIALQIYSSSSFFALAETVNNTLEHILQYSGWPSTILVDIDSVVKTFLNNFGQQLSSYSIEFFGKTVTTYFEIITTLKLTLTTLVENSTNLTVIGSSVTKFIEYIGYYIVLVAYISNTIIDHIHPALEETITILGYVTFIIFALIKYVLLLVVSINPIATLPSNTVPAITALSTAMTHASNAFITLSDPSLGGIVESIPLYTRATYVYLNSVQNLTPAFGNNSLIYQTNRNNILVDLNKYVLSEHNFKIGKVTGAQIFNDIITQFPHIIPHLLTNVNRTFSGHYEIYAQNAKDLATSFVTIANLNVSITLNNIAQDSSSVVTQILPYSGLIESEALVLFLSTFSNSFISLGEIIVNYEVILGTNVADILLQELYLYRTTLTKLIRNVSDSTAITDNIIDTLDSLEYLLVTVVTIVVTVTANNVLLDNSEVYIALSILLNTAYVLYDYALFLLVPLITQSNTLNYVSEVIDNSVASIKLTATYLTNISKTISDGNAFTTTVVNALPIILNATIKFLNVKSLSNILNVSNFSLENSSKIYTALQKALSELSGSIGTLTGDQIIRTITSAYPNQSFDVTNEV